MEAFSAADVKTLIRLLANASDPTVERPIVERQRALLDGLRSVLSADAWLWFSGEYQSLSGTSELSSGLLYEGFQDDDEPIEVFQRICRPIVQAAFAPELVPCQAIEEHPRLIEMSPANGAVRSAARVTACDIVAGDHMTAFRRRPNDGTYSGVSFHRRRGRVAFTAHERSLAELMFEQVDWLQSAPSEADLNGSVATLSPREREVMNLLLNGSSRKQVAHQLALSTHTVADYLKQIYIKLGVSSRAELLAKFIPGNRES